MPGKTVQDTVTYRRYVEDRPVVPELGDIVDDSIEINLIRTNMGHF
jgi:hypothetical protein